MIHFHVVKVFKGDQNIKCSKVAKIFGGGQGGSRYSGVVLVVPSKHMTLSQRCNNVVNVKATLYQRQRNKGTKKNAARLLRWLRIELAVNFFVILSDKTLWLLFTISYIPYLVNT